MLHSEFVHLHNHTEYSLLDGACSILDEKGKPSELIQTISHRFKMPALAITDHGNMYGAIEFYNACRSSGIKPIIGCEIYVAPGSRFDKASVGRGMSDSYFHLTLLAKDFEGYQNLMHLVSCGFLEGFYYKPRVDKELLEKYHKGIIALSGCMKGEVGSLILKDDIKKAEEVANQYLNIFGKGNFYLEIMDQGLEDQKKINASLIKLSKKTGIPLVATNDCHYLKKEDAFDHDVLLCIGTGKNLDEPDRMRFSSDQFYYRPPEEMIKLFSSVPDAIKNTLEIAEKTSLELNFNQLLLPDYPVPKNTNAEDYLEKLCIAGMNKRYPAITQVHKDRLSHELSIIKKMGFAPYFLIVWDFIKYAKEQNIPVGPGRGSGAGSLVAYSLGITDICPLKYGLLFERFLNPERRTMPDLDIDFADTGRDQVIEYVRNKYGHNNCAQIITFGSMQARLVIRDVARAMGFTPGEGDRIAKMIPFGMNIYSSLQTVSELRALVRNDERVKRLLTSAKKLEGLKRHTGVHAAGMVIAKEEITKFTPLSKGSRDVVTTQYNDKALLKLGLLKVDFLGLRNLTIIEETVGLIRERSDLKFSIENIPLEDKKTFKLLSDAKTLGVFQLESKGMRDLVRKLKPTNIEDIIALVALYRPGPMGSGMIDDFVSRKHGHTKVKYDHPILEPILKDTYGVILYQEQVMRIAQDFAGFSAGEADVLRRAMGKKIPEEIEKQRENFVQGAKKKGIENKLAVKIFEQIVHFGGYGFNKSHAGAYGMVAYRTAYLKANYPLEYMTALLNSEIGRSAVGKEEEISKLVSYIQEAESMGIKVLEPDIQESQSSFSIEGKNIRFGLLAIKNVGSGACESIVESRRQKGKFKTWEDFISRIDLHAANRKVLESLIKAGAFDGFGESYIYTRSELMAHLDRSIEWAGSHQQDVSRGQELLFEMTELVNNSFDKSAKVEPWSEHAALSYEKEVLGFYLSGHPLAQHTHDLLMYSQYRLDRLPSLRISSSASLTSNFGSSTRQPIVRLAGMISSVKRLVTKEKKEQYARFKLEDLYGEVEVVVFPKSYKNGLSKHLTLNNVVVVKGRFSDRGTDTELLAEEIMPLDEAKSKLPAFVGSVYLMISSAGLEDEVLDEVKRVIKEYPGDSPVFLEVTVPGHGEYLVDTGIQVKPGSGFFQNIEKLLGPESLDLRTSSV
ncbi:MAG: DNA polymerase III subunit alpha [Endomicrobiales bacterium]|nr:DNA polymerase III subunit alpha [Endomicrobiales bacterium]